MEKQKSIFVLETISAMGNRYPRREVIRHDEAFFSTLAKAEDRLQAVVRAERKNEEEGWKSDHVGYVIYERPVDTPEGSCLTQISARNYSLDGKLLDECLTPDDPQSVFNGHEESKIHFHRGDIVEDVDGAYAELSIVAITPPTPEECAARKERAKKMFPETGDDFAQMDCTDDVYLVYSLGEGDTHSHPLCYNVFPPSKPVSKKLERQLRDKLKEMEALYGESKK